MKQEFKQQLLQTFPSLFSEPGRCFEIDDGWFILYHQLCSSLVKATPGMRILQAKQKFGALRVYYKDGDEAARKLIDAAERSSVQTCERCGLPGVLRRTRAGYIGTACPFHRNKRYE